jgi:RNA polymerase sigma factor (TIGR02999 family)
MTDVTLILDKIGQGDTHAAEELLPLIYAELRRLARAQMAQERPAHTLQPTALVHEAYLRLVQVPDLRWGNRRHFFAAAAEAMRRILIEHARRKNSLKRGGQHERVELADEPPAIASPCDDVDDLLSLDEALDRLALEHPDAAELVKLIYFAGLNLVEAGAAQGISRTSAYRRWLFARAWLHHAITGEVK